MSTGGFVDGNRKKLNQMRSQRERGTRKHHPLYQGKLNGLEHQNDLVQQQEEYETGGGEGMRSDH